VRDTRLIRSLRAAVRARPDDVPLRLHLAELLLDLGQIDEAVTHIAAALHREPASVQGRELMTRAMARPPDAATAGPMVPVGQRRQRGDEPTERHSFNWGAAERQFVDTTQPRLLDRGTQPLTSVSRDDIETVRTRLTDLGGLVEMKRRLDALLLTPARAGQPTRGGILLYGPPGCGKAYLARAAAGELGAKFLRVSMAELRARKLGTVEQNVRDVFTAATRATPCVLLLDGIEVLDPKRPHARGAAAARATFRRLLAELDAVAKQTRNAEGIIVLATTSEPWDLDRRLRDNGRFDRTLLVLPPDPPAREAILHRHLLDRPTGAVRIPELVKRTEDFSAADLVRLCEAAAEHARLDSVRSRTARMIDMRDFDAALGTVRPSVGGWLAAARDAAANAGGDGYEELSHYLDRRRP
jgi:SpoVK/Ycf46/Vps4 family AAA+-type ATPase